MASAYELTLSQDSKFKKVWQKITLNKPEYVFKHAAPTVYYIRLRSLGPDRRLASLKSKTVQMEVVVPKSLQQPSPKFPKENSLVSASKIEKEKLKLYWSHVADATHYQLQFSRDKLFKDILHNKKFKKNGVMFGDRLPKGQVYWRVRANGRSGEKSKWSEPRSLQVQ